MRLLLDLTNRDNSGTFRCHRVAKLAEIGLDRIRLRGYSFLEKILLRCQQVGCRICETPVLFKNHRGGVTKINKARR